MAKKEILKKSSRPDMMLKGVLDITRSGIGYVIVENQASDILVKPSDLNTALHGDTVRVKIQRENFGRRVQGVITEVVTRKRTEFIGRLEMNKNFAFFIAEMDKPMPDIYIPLKKINGAQEGDKVVVKLTEWGKGGKRPEGEVVSILDPEDENNMAMKEILVQNGFTLGFSEDAIEEAGRLSDIIPKTELKKEKIFATY